MSEPLNLGSDDHAASARFLAFDRCEPSHAVACNKLWHSRLPECQRGPWMYAFRAHYNGLTHAVALWHNPSARTLPGHWIELRRMACAPYAPKFTASRFLGWMLRWFRRHRPEHEKAISYQDPAVHSGTIYKACGWTVAHAAKDRVRDRSGVRPSGRRYRWNQNGPIPDSVGKIRWEKQI